MLTNINEILAVMLVLLTLFILVKHSFPSLSSFFKEKIMGIKPSESFDLDTMIQKKIHLYKIHQGTEQGALEQTLKLQNQLEALEFIHSLSWDASSRLTKLNNRASQMGLSNNPSIQEMKQTFEQLRKIEIFEQSSSLSLEKLKNYILFYSFFFPHEMNSKQRKDFYIRTYKRLETPPEDFKGIIESYQAEFSS